MIGFKPKKSKGWPPCEIGDVVAIKWQDPSVKDISVNEILHNQIEIVHSITHGHVIKIEDDKIFITSERVYDDDSGDTTIHAFPKRTIHEVIIIMPRDMFQKAIDPLVTADAQM